MRILDLNKENTDDLLKNLLKRSPTNYDSYEKDVKSIIDDISKQVPLDIRLLDGKC